MQIALEMSREFALFFFLEMMIHSSFKPICINIKAVPITLLGFHHLQEIYFYFQYLYYLVMAYLAYFDTYYTGYSVMGSFKGHWVFGGWNESSSLYFLQIKYILNQMRLSSCIYLQFNQTSIRNVISGLFSCWYNVQSILVKKLIYIVWCLPIYN